ncbi:unnamed protein product [Phytophthora lilii]|uniref:Unnamed protein product n=1 Tax=Phytophthora lilii TaxID=2077276 RepID=A0A9W7CS56_9STRA|nr:unnamed protein product [Phytophthora lilii]
MVTWVITEKITQGQLENRLHHFSFTNDPRNKQADKEQDSRGNTKSFKQAITGTPLEPIIRPNEDKEYQKWYRLCMQPASKVNELRPRTKEEDEALTMTLKPPAGSASPTPFPHPVDGCQRVSDVHGHFHGP